MRYASGETGSRDETGMSESTKVGAASLAEFVRATADAEFDEGDAERVANLLANTKGTLGTLADRPRFDAEPAEIAAVMRRLAPGAVEAGTSGDAS